MCPRFAVPARRRRGFTLLELIVTLGIIVLLLTLMLPAVNVARQAARRTLCQNNLKQIGLALVHYHEVFETLPPGYIARDVAATDDSHAETGPGFAWGSLLLPYLDQVGLANSIDWDRDATDPANMSAMGTVCSVWFCGAGPIPQKFDLTTGLSLYLLGSSSYVGMYGIGDLTAAPGQPEGAGVFSRNSHTPMWGIADGLSNTIFAAERAAWHEFEPGQPGTPPNSTWYAAIPGADRPVGTGANLQNRVGPASLVLGTAGWDGPQPVTLLPNHTDHIAAFSSHHAGGLHLLLGDSSVRFTSDQIDAQTFRQLAQQRDSQPVGEF